MCSLHTQHTILLREIENARRESCNNEKKSNSTNNKLHSNSRICVRWKKKQRKAIKQTQNIFLYIFFLWLLALLTFFPFLFHMFYRARTDTRIEIIGIGKAAAPMCDYKKHFAKQINGKVRIASGEEEDEKYCHCICM